MSISDPGEKFPYLIVKTDNSEFLVRKSCRAVRFDPFWESEPVPEDFKPDMTLLASEVPFELWEALSEEEKLRCSLADAKATIRKLKSRNQTLFGAIFVIAIIGWTFAVLFFSKHGWL
jgi:hypothetical protein